ncbi:MAG TPA: SPFH domain-containing protein [Thermoflexia bacterium]|nr:SPFH domain-containing protein [Thermoflexia bacterium]
MARIFDIVEYVDEGRQEIVHRIPERGSGDFRLGSQLIVRDGQAAIFYRDGKALDAFGAGRHTLTTANVPLLTDLLGKAFSGRTPFKAEVYFVTLRELTDMKWGTKSPITIQDPILGMARVTGYGTYAIQITEPQLFVNKLVGTQGLYRTRDIESFFRSIIMTKLMDLIGEMGKSVIQMAAFAEELAAGVRAKAAEEFAARGVTLNSFYIESLSPTEETAKAIDARSAMGAIGDMNAYMQYQGAQAMRDAAQNESGGMAGAGVGLGAGMGMGAGMAQMFTQSMQQGQRQQAPPPQTAAPPAPASPQTAAEIQQLLDSLDNRLITGELSEKIYERLYAKWEKRLANL